MSYLFPLLFILLLLPLGLSLFFWPAPKLEDLEVTERSHGYPADGSDA